MTRAAAWRVTMNGPPSAGPFARCAGEGKWAPGSCRCDGCVVGGGVRGDRCCQLAALPRPAGARFAVEKQLGAAWRPASHRLPPPPLLRQSVYPAVSPRTGDLGRMLTELRAWWPVAVPRCHVLGAGGAETPGSMAGLSPSCPRHTVPQVCCLGAWDTWLGGVATGPWPLPGLSCPQALAMWPVRC